MAFPPWQCTRCTQPAVLDRGLCHEHLALGADPIFDMDGNTDNARFGSGTKGGAEARRRSKYDRRGKFQKCDCGTALYKPGQLECDRCRWLRATRVTRKCDCGRDVNHSNSSECDECRWARARGEVPDCDKIFY